MRVALTVLLSGAAVCANAQLPTLLPGSRVKVESDPRAKIEGTVMSQTADSITVAQSGAVRMTFPSASVSLVKASEGHSHMAGAIKGAKIGVVVLGGLGAVLGAALYDYEGFDSGDYVSFVVRSGAYGAFWGSGIGAIVGGEKWTTVYKRQPRVTGLAVPAREGFAVGFSVRY